MMPGYCCIHRKMLTAWCGPGSSFASMTLTSEHWDRALRWTLKRWTASGKIINMLDGNVWKNISLYSHFIYRGEMWLWFLLSGYLFTIILLVRLTVIKVKRSAETLLTPPGPCSLFSSHCSQLTHPGGWPLTSQGVNPQECQTNFVFIFLNLLSNVFELFTLTMFYFKCME